MSAAAPIRKSAADEAREAAAQRPKVLRELYPEIAQPNKSGFLKVSDLHTCYWEECGNPEGKPIITVHGGPGGGSNAFYRQFFDPKAYRIIQFDQRGAGQSTPYACLEENTTWDLVEDMEKLRKFLNINRWVVAGGSLVCRSHNAQATFVRFVYVSFCSFENCHNPPEMAIIISPI